VPALLLISAATTPLSLRRGSHSTGMHVDAACIENSIVWDGNAMTLPGQAACVSTQARIWHGSCHRKLLGSSSKGCHRPRRVNRMRSMDAMPLLRGCVGHCLSNGRTRCSIGVTQQADKSPRRASCPSTRRSSLHTPPEALPVASGADLMSSCWVSMLNTYRQRSNSHTPPEPRTCDASRWTGWQWWC
jgi:hypothetical protein